MLLLLLSRGRTIAIRIISLFGVILSAYALFVEHKVTAQKARAAKLGVDAAAGTDDEAPFVALCDLGSWASCSDVLTSPSSRLFGPPNAALGVLFYSAVFLYPSINFVPFREELLLLATAFSCSLSIYLATVLMKMGDFCILCVSTYVCNFSLLVVVIREYAAKRRELKIRKAQKKAL